MKNDGEIVRDKKKCWAFLAMIVSEHKPGLKTPLIKRMRNNCETPEKSLMNLFGLSDIRR